jgi:hypothetical protein
MYLVHLDLDQIHVLFCLYFIMEGVYIYKMFDSSTVKEGEILLISCYLLTSICQIEFC